MGCMGLRRYTRADAQWSLIAEFVVEIMHTSFMYETDGMWLV